MNQPNEDMPAVKTFSFSTGRVYEVTGIWVRDGKAKDLDAYFGKVFPIAVQDYGLRPVFSLEPISAYAGDFVPNVMFVNEWPSLDHFKRFVSDPRCVALFGERDAAVSRLVVTQYEIPEDTRVEIRSGQVVEFAGMWVKAGMQDEIKAYYAEAFPVAQRHGARGITRLAPVYSYRGDFQPTIAGLNLWDSHDDFKRFAAEAAALFPRRDAALDRLEVTHARVRFEGGK